MKFKGSFWAVRALFLFVLLGVGFFTGSTMVFAVGEPVVINQSVESISQTSAIPFGEVTDEGIAAVIGIWVEYGVDNTYGSEVQRYNLNELTIPGVFDVPISGLTCDTTYHYRFKIRNNGMLDGYSPDATFTTSACDPVADPVFSVPSNINGEVGTRIAVTDLQIVGEGDPDLDIYLYVPNGVLSMDTITGLTFNDNIETGSSLYFSGSLTDLNTALATLHFEGAESGEFDLEATIITPGAIFYPGSNHVYEVVVEETAVSANAAKIAANARTFNGIPGYLATITSVEENNYISARLTSSGWIGASDADVEGDWKWIDGPEEGTSFWLGGDNGTPVGERYVNWNPGEPNGGVNESCLEFIVGVGEKWNDLPCGDDPGNPRFAYVVEYGEDGNLPTVSNTSLTITVTTGVSFDSGGGTSSEDPYMISTCSQLQLMNEYLDSYFQLSGDIDCSVSASWNSNGSEWVDGVVDGELIPDSYSTDTGSAVVVTNNGYFGFEPIGDDETPFTGRLDGDDYTISNLWIFRKNTNRVGLFGSIQDAHILRVNLVDSDIVGSDNTGGLVGLIGENSEVTDIDLENNMVRAYLAYNGGGLAGRIEYSTAISNITNTGGVVHGSGSVIGGIVGSINSSTINNATSSAAVDGGYQVGGLVGNMNQSTITNSSATGNVQSDRLESNLFVKTGYYAGGFVGDMYQSTIEDSYATGDVNTTGDYAGGFAGSITESTITNSHALGDVTGVNETIGENNYTPNYLGGFAGRAESESLIQSSYAGGTVVTDGDNVGGFIGASYCGTDIEYSYAAGISVTGGNNVGGFVGFSGCEGPGTNFTQVALIGDVTGDEYVGGFAGYLSTADVTNAYTFASTVTGNEYVGGFAGSMNYADTNNVYSKADVVASGAEFAGGFAGYNFNDGVPIEGFWDTTIEAGLTGCGNAGGLDCDGITGKTTVEMNTRETFDAAGYNFDDVWAIDETNDGYPYFPDFDIVEGPAEIMVTTNTATDITQTSAVLNATVTEGSFNAYGFFIGTESYANNEVPEYDQFSEIGDLFGAMLALYQATDGTGSPDVVGSPFDYGTPFGILECGVTYYFRPIVYLGMETNLGMGIGDEGSFTTLACDESEPEPEPEPETPRASRGIGGFRTSTRTQTPQKPTSSQPNTCPADQILNQNLKTGARNGRYHSYTKAVVVEANRLQAHLNRLGFNSGPVDGILGPISDGAIKRMQTLLGTTPDGYVGPITRGLLNQSCGAEGLKRS